jgi:hypothetical protein
MTIIQENGNILGVQIELDDPDAFLKVKETLTRIGIPSLRTKTLYQSVHILHKRGNYYLMHFKEMFALDGKSSDISEDDVKRRNLIASLLQDWGLLKVKSTLGERAKISTVKVIPFSEKNDWQLEAKYSVGGRSKKNLSA